MDLHPKCWWAVWHLAVWTLFVGGPNYWREFAEMVDLDDFRRTRVPLLRDRGWDRTTIAWPCCRDWTPSSRFVSKPTSPVRLNLWENRESPESYPVFQIVSSGHEHDLIVVDSAGTRVHTKPSRRCEDKLYYPVAQRIQLEGLVPWDHLTDPVGANRNTFIGGVAGKIASLRVQDFGSQPSPNIGIHEQGSSR